MADDGNHKGFWTVLALGAWLEGINLLLNSAMSARTHGLGIDVGVAALAGIGALAMGVWLWRQRKLS